MQHTSQLSIVSDLLLAGTGVTLIIRKQQKTYLLAHILFHMTCKM